MPSAPRILVSSCLLGQPVRYDGQAKPLLLDGLTRLEAEAQLIPFCPELAGGLSVPRLPAEIEPGYDGRDVLAGRARVIDSGGGDVTDAFLAGAQMAVQRAATDRCAHALLTEASPSCGVLTLYSGRFDGRRCGGMGVTVAALQAAEVITYSSEQVEILIEDLALMHLFTQRSK